MTPTPYAIPETPPAELLAELTLAMDEPARRLRIELAEDGATQQLSPRQLIDVLS